MKDPKGEDSREIRVAIVGVGNCANSLIQGLEFYRQNPTETKGLMNPDIGGYRVTDIVPVAAFEVDARKVGKDLAEAIFAKPNVAYRYPGVQVGMTGVQVMMGPVLDGVPPHLEGTVQVSDASPCDVAAVLRETRAEMLLNFLPTGSAKATRFYADCAIKETGIGFVNGMPELIACDPDYQRAAEEHQVPLIGDDVKSQFGGTIVHRALVKLMAHRGIHIDKTYQLNYAGNTDFGNLMVRGASKHRSKKAAVEWLVPYDLNMSVNVSFIENMGDRKTAVWHVEACNFAGAPLHFEAKMEVEDSPNFAGVMVDMIRYCRIALDRGTSGVLTSASAFLCKQSPTQIDDELAMRYLTEFVEGRRER